MSQTQTQSGKITQVIGPVVDVEFPPGALPEIYTALTVTNPGIDTRPDNLVIEVAERSEQHWRDGARAVQAGLVGLSALEERVGAIAGAVATVNDLLIGSDLAVVGEVSVPNSWSTGSRLLPASAIAAHSAMPVPPTSRYFQVASSERAVRLK